uniref:Uncharacterized protein n=1 Tax=Rhizophora mucronata TaxID=61149 RepID=A0A2P2R1G1_RHIMU
MWCRIYPTSYQLLCFLK